LDIECQYQGLIGDKENNLAGPEWLACAIVQDVKDAVQRGDVGLEPGSSVLEGALSHQLGCKNNPTTTLMGLTELKNFINHNSRSRQQIFKQSKAHLLSKFDSPYP
jgi:hypothetical protein